MILLPLGWRPREAAQHRRTRSLSGTGQRARARHVCPCLTPLTVPPCWCLGRGAQVLVRGRGEPLRQKVPAGEDSQRTAGEHTGKRRAANRDQGRANEPRARARRSCRGHALGDPVIAIVLHCLRFKFFFYLPADAHHVDESLRLPHLSSAKQIRSQPAARHPDAANIRPISLPPTPPIPSPPRADHHRQRGGAAVHPQVHGPGPLIAVFRFLRPPSLPSTPAVSIAGRRIHGQLLRPEASGGIPTPPHPRSFDVSPSLARPARALKGGRWASCSGGGGHRREDRGFDSTSFAESQ